MSWPNMSSVRSIDITNEYSLKTTYEHIIFFVSPVYVVFYNGISHKNNFVALKI